MVNATHADPAGAELLATKLFAPTWRPGLVSRPRLVERLRQGAQRRLTLISAPPGFGKSTLLGEWLARLPDDYATAWVSLDAADNDPQRFWAYVIGALQSVRAGIGATAGGLLTSSQAPPIEQILTSLINDLAGTDRQVALILDDLHAIESRAIHDGLAFLLDHLPVQVHLIIASRADPPLPLARLRARGELTEIRATDLRFTPEEAAAFLTGMMGLQVSAEDVRALEARTEGWIAGLQLAALSLQGRTNSSGFISAFAGDDRYIVDYLAEEVLHRQPEPIRQFLLRTSILDELSGPLCDDVTGQQHGGDVLRNLERSNLFLVPLDDKRVWYRYHHLFADVLRAHLQDEQPDEVAVLHGRASRWYERNEQPGEAVRHALAAGDIPWAASLVERYATVMRQRRREATLLAWCKALPADAVSNRPVLAATFAGALLQNGELGHAEDLLTLAESWVVAPSPGMIVVDQDEFRRLPAFVAVHRSGIAFAAGNLDAAAMHARHALEVGSGDDHFYRGAALSLLGLASWANGNLDDAERFYADGMASLRRAGYVTDTIGGMLALSDIRLAQGRLRDAMETFETTARQATDPTGNVLRGAADMHVGMAGILLERNDLVAARAALDRSAALGEFAGFPQNPWRTRMVMALLRVAEGDLEVALALLTEAEGLYVSDYHPNVRPLGAMKARVLIRQGRLDQAQAWVRERGLSADDEPEYLREYELVTLARLLIARYREDGSSETIREATDLLERLLAAAESGKRASSVIEILALQGLALAAQGDVPAALDSLERALAMAEPEGYVRLFTSEGEPMRTLLRQVASRTGVATYARRLLTAFEEAPAGTAAAPRGATPGLPEPLTARELEVLHLIAAGLRNEEIADRLFISLATVKRHIANAYGKLGAGHRVEAIRRATDLGLLNAQ